MGKGVARDLKWAAMACCAAIGAVSCAAFAESAGPVPAAAPLTGADVSAWLDGFMPSALARNGVAGAMVVVVRDGAVLVEKGYGFADVATKTPVDPKTTLFRPGSISKLFTWTAVMQLVEAGKLDLDADVNKYLDFTIPPRNGKPITLRHLLTHTPGFEEDSKALIVKTNAHRLLEQEIKRWVPTRVYDAGTTPAYSNYGATLAGYIVQRVSRMPFEKYVDERIFKPLGMNSSTFEQPLPERFVAHMSKGYRSASQPAEPFEFVSMPPAGSLSATGDDMAKFMIAHLQDGRLGDARILNPDTAHLMHDSRTSLMAPLNGIELGFYDQNINGHRVIAHGGDTQYFHSELILFVDDHVGLYVSLNSAGVPGGGGVRQPLFEGFADRYFPATSTDGTVDAKTASEHVKMAVGRYVSARGSFTNFMALLGLIGQLEVTGNSDGTISISLLKTQSGEPRHYREIAPFVWREVGGHDRIGAILKDGRIVRISSDWLSAVMVFDRAPAAVSAAWLLPAIETGIAVLLLTLIAWPIAAVTRRRFKVAFPLEGRRRAANRLLRMTLVVTFAALAGWSWVASVISENFGMESLAHHDALLILIQALTLTGTVGGVAAAGYNLYVVWSESSTWFARLWSMLIAVSFLVVFWMAVAGKLMSFSVQY